MAANTPIITDAAQSAADQNLSDYAAGVNNHINGDWWNHNCLNTVVYPYSYNSISILAQKSQKCILLRGLFTIDDVDTALFLPLIPFNDTPETTSPAAEGTLPNTDPVTITSQPKDLTVYLGEVATFSIVTAGKNPITYSWTKDGVVLSGAVSSTLTIAYATYANAGVYQVTATNATGTVTSATATLRVLGFFNYGGGPFPT